VVALVGAVWRRFRCLLDQEIAAQESSGLLDIISGGLTFFDMARPVDPVFEDT